jgi:hydroxymethylglutaryl-CoA lyase
LQDITRSKKIVNLKTRAYVSVAWECPYEGKVDSKVVLDIANQMLLASGADEIILADTIGAANPAQVLGYCSIACVNEFGNEIFIWSFS